MVSEGSYLLTADSSNRVVPRRTPSSLRAKGFCFKEWREFDKKRQRIGLVRDALKDEISLLETDDD